MPAPKPIPSALPSSFTDTIDELAAVRDALDCVASLLASVRAPFTLYFLIDTVCQRMARACTPLDKRPRPDPSTKKKRPGIARWPGRTTCGLLDGVGEIVLGNLLVQLLSQTRQIGDGVVTIHRLVVIGA